MTAVIELTLSINVPLLNLTHQTLNMAYLNDFKPADGVDIIVKEFYRVVSWDGKGTL